ncbi:MAG: lectin like domain-containing protein, partial [Oscillospiraceae bacterium]|nr:lectin like domain-containing protein [Oscillospiraceae bacterium]
MRLFKRGLSVALALMLAFPAFLNGEADALTTSNYIPESNNPFFQDSGAVLETGLATSYRSADAISKMTLGQGGTLPVSSDGNASWAHAAVALLNAQGTGPYSIADLVTATTKNAGNRSMVTAYLMRGTKAGPKEGFSYITDAVTPANEKPAKPVTGITYIPDLRVTDGTEAEDKYLSRIKKAVQDKGAVAASMYFTRDFLHETPATQTSRVWIYDNNSAVTGAAGSMSPDHTVIIAGWDDGQIGTYERTVTETDSEGKITTRVETVTVTGAFLVYDSLGDANSPMGGSAYWVSYETALSGAYYIEGFFQNPFSIFSARTDSDNKPTKTNPLAVTYEYDLNGQTGVKPVGGSEAYYANVFDVKDGATALHAVSVFLTGENNNYKVYLIKDYKKIDDLKEDPSQWTLLAEGSKALPGYYTFALEGDAVNTEGIRISSTELIAGKKFAIVVINDSTSNSVPLQTGGATTRAGQGYTSSNGADWNDVGTAAICIKAHAEKDVDILLTDVEIRDADGELVDDDAINPLEAAPGGTFTLGPTMVPATANDILYGMTVWTADLPYYERDDEGYLKEENVKEIAGEYVLVTGVPDAEGNPVPMDGLPAVQADLVWNQNFGLFLPESYKSTGKESGWKPNAAKVSVDGTDKIVTVENYIEQPISLTNPASSSALASLKVSKESVYFDTDSTVIPMTVTVTKGKKVNGKFLGTPPDKYETNGTVDYSFSVKITAEMVAAIELSKSSHTLKAGSSVTLSAKQLDAEQASVAERKLTWKIAKSYTTVPAGEDGNTVEGKQYADFPQTYNPADPYNPDGPVAIVDKDGKVTALRDGTCYVYAEAGGVRSEPCMITVTKVAPTGISLSKKKYTVSVNTMLTLTANVKPSGASNKRVKWKSSDTQIATVGEYSGIIEVVKTGVVTITATTVTGGFKAECVLTVTGAPSIIKKGKTVTFSVLGAGSKDKVLWSLQPLDSGGSTQQNPETGELIDNATKETILSGSQSGAKYKVKSSGVGNAKLTATVVVPMTGEDGVEVDQTVRQQSWYIESVVPISKMEFRSTADELVKKLTLCIDSNGKNGESATLAVRLVKPADATMLGFTWTSKVDKATQKPMVEIVSGAPNEYGEPVITVRALVAGTAKITGVSYNGNKKINLSIKILQYPKSNQITVKSNAVEVVPGKKVSLKGKVSDKGLNKDLRYTLYSDSEMTTVISGWNPVTGMYREDEPNAPTEQQASL